MSPIHPICRNYQRTLAYLAAFALFGCGSSGRKTDAYDGSVTPSNPTGGTVSAIVTGGTVSAIDTGGTGSTDSIGTGGNTASDDTASTIDNGSGGLATGGTSNGGSFSGTGGATAFGGSTSPNDPCGLSNSRVVPLPTIPAVTFDVKTYGATGNGATDDTKSLQAALTAAANAGGGTVTVPKGTFLCGPLTVGNSTRLDLAAGAILKMLPKASYPSITPLLSASSAHDIALTGSGTIDGQGQDWWTAFAKDSSVERTQEVVFLNSTRVLVSGIHLQNSPNEHIWVKGDKDVTITGITISTLPVSGMSPPKNTDGIDITANGAFLCGNHIECGDDNIALSGSNIYIGHSVFGVGHGCSIGSITKNGTSKLTVENNTFNGTSAGIRMKSGRDRGGMVQGLTYSNLTMINVQNPIYITSYYPTMPTNPTTDTEQATVATTPYWKDILIKDVTITGSTNAGILWGLPEAKITNIVFDNVQDSANTGMVIYHATGISFINGSTVTPKSGAAVKLYDATVTGIATTSY